MMRRLLPLFLGAAQLSGCSGLSLLNAITPRDGYTLTADIAYGEVDRRRLDVYAPKPVLAVNPPVIVFVYGGSWDSGDRRDYRFVGEALTRRGYIAVIPDYRLHPQARYPEFIDDTAAATAWALKHAQRLGGDGRVYLMGHSAGAYNAAMVAYDPTRTSSLGPARLAGFIGLAGPFDFSPDDTPVTRRVFGSVPDPASTQPVNLVTAGDPPALLLHGEDDRTVQPRNSRSLAHRLARVGVPARLREFPGVGHVGILLALSPLRRNDPPVLDELDAFIAAQSKPIPDPAGQERSGQSP